MVVADLSVSSLWEPEAIRRVIEDHTNEAGVVERRPPERRGPEVVTPAAASKCADVHSLRVAGPDSVPCTASTYGQQSAVGVGVAARERAARGHRGGRRSRSWSGAGPGSGGARPCRPVVGNTPLFRLNLLLEETTCALGRGMLFS